MARSLEGPKDLTQRLTELEDRIRNLERTRQLGNSSVDAGSVIVNGGQITAKHPNGVELFRTGTGSTVLPFESSPTEGFVTRIRRASGQIVMQVFSSLTGAEAKLQINDRNGNEILGDDWLVGKGLSRPWIPLNMYRSSDATTPPVIVTSASYVATYTFEANVQHPAVTMRIRIAADIGTAGNFRLYDTFFNYTMMTQAISAGYNDVMEITCNLNGLRGYGNNVLFELQVQRTAGSGNIRILPLSYYGRNAASV